MSNERTVGHPSHQTLNIVPDTYAEMVELEDTLGDPQRREAM
jgi:hypothetical protein